MINKGLHLNTSFNSNHLLTTFHAYKNWLTPSSLFTHVPLLDQVCFIFLLSIYNPLLGTFTAAAAAARLDALGTFTFLSLAKGGDKSSHRWS